MHGYPLPASVGHVPFSVPGGTDLPLVSMVSSACVYVCLCGLPQIHKKNEKIIISHRTSFYLICIDCIFRDILLLEVGFLTILVAPVSRRSWSEYRPRNLVTMWLIRWALFRLMFASGVVKLQSGCPTWWGLTGRSKEVRSSH